MDLYFLSTVQAGGAETSPTNINEMLTGLIVSSERVGNKKLDFLFMPNDISLYYSKNNSDLTKNSED